MSSQRTNLLLKLDVVGASVGDFGPGPTAEFIADLFWPSGTSANQADRYGYDIRTLGGSSNEDIDLATTTALTPDGSALGLAEVRALIIKADAANSANIEVKPSASNGWTSLLKDATDIIQIPPGKFVAIAGGADGSWAVSGTNKSININNLHTGDGSYTIFVVGVSA